MADDIPLLAEFAGSTWSSVFRTEFSQPGFVLLNPGPEFGLRH